MGNKSSIRAVRLGISQTHDADWYMPGSCASTIKEDWDIRKYLEKRIAQAGVIRVVISRIKECVELKISCIKPSVVVGKKGAEVESLSQEIGKIINKDVRVKVFEVRKPELSAAAIAKNVAMEIQRKGVSCRRVIKRFVQNSKRSGALGVKIQCSGRLSGAEIARTEWYQEGAVPRQKFRANIDYAACDSYSSWGVSGVKVWVYKGDVLGKPKKDEFMMTSRRRVERTNE